jgi:hypothetical protein
MAAEIAMNMKDTTIWLVTMIACSFLVTPLTAQDKKLTPDPAKRQVFFGEQHLHTTISLDAYIMGNHKNTPTDAFNYNKGKVVEKYLTGEKLQRNRASIRPKASTQPSRSAPILHQSGMHRRHLKRRKNELAIGIIKVQKPRREAANEVENFNQGHKQ